MKLCGFDVGLEMSGNPRAFNDMLDCMYHGGKIALLVGVNSDLTVEGLQVLSHSETPGLGGEITKPAFQSQFAGKGSSGPLAVNKDGGEIVAISSATISSRAVVAGVNTVRDLAATLVVAGGAGR